MVISLGELPIVEADTDHRANCFGVMPFVQRGRVTAFWRGMTHDGYELEAFHLGDPMRAEPHGMIVHLRPWTDQDGRSPFEEAPPHRWPTYDEIVQLVQRTAIEGMMYTTPPFIMDPTQELKPEPGGYTSLFILAAGAREGTPAARRIVTPTDLPAGPRRAN